MSLPPPCLFDVMYLRLLFMTTDNSVVESRGNISFDTVRTGMICSRYTQVPLSY